MAHELPGWFEIVALLSMLGVLAVDLGLAWRRPHVPSAAESGLWVGVYVVLALLFAWAVLAVGGPQAAGGFVAGWLTEYSLSVDNLFVFLVIMARFAVPRSAQQVALMVGVLIALVLRGVFIAVGAGLIDAFEWVFYLFGAFLIYTAVRESLRGGEGEAELAVEDEGRFTSWLRRRLRVASEFDGAKLRVTIGGVRLLTPLVLVFAALGATDLLFALDSIPAIFGITTDAFLVFATNVFALMGLRQLYFLLGHLLERLAYLRYGVSVILAFIGVKLVLQALHDNELPFVNGGRGLEWAPTIGTGTSIGVIVAAMALSVAASLMVPGRGASR